MSTCPHCQKIFSSVGACNHHQKTARYCLKLRKKSKTKYRCPDCDNTFSSLSNRQKHVKKCPQRLTTVSLEKERLQTELLMLRKSNDRLHEQLSVLQEQNEGLITQIRELAVMGMNKPTTMTTNNMTTIQFNAPLNLTPETIQEKMAGLTSTHLVNGVEAVVGWIRDELLVDTDSGDLLYRCTNPKDGTFRYLDENGMVQKDCRGRKLISMIQQPFNDRGAEVCAELVEEVDRTSSAEPEERARAVERMRMGHTTFLKLRKMKESSRFVRELGVITYN